MSTWADMAEEQEPAVVTPVRLQVAAAAPSILDAADCSARLDEEGASAVSGLLTPPMAMRIKFGDFDSELDNSRVSRQTGGCRGRNGGRASGRVKLGIPDASHTEWQRKRNHTHLVRASHGDARRQLPTHFWVTIR